MVGGLVLQLFSSPEKWQADMALITCTGAEFSYDGHTVISGLNFEINSGDYLVIVGENGSGKSTLIKGLLRLKQPSTGTIMLESGLKQNEIGYLPQQTSVQRNFPASVSEVVISGRLNRRGLRPFYSKEDSRIADENIERMGISNLKRKSYRELSGGQQQRVLLARALCATKKLLLLDEPGAGLDPLVTTELYSLIKSLNRDSCLTIIMVSHDVNIAVEYSSHVLHLASSQLFFGKTADYKISSAGKRFLGNEDNG